MVSCILTGAGLGLTLLYLAITYESNALALMALITVLFCVLETVELALVHMRVKGKIDTPIKVADIDAEVTVTVTVRSRCPFMCSRVLLQLRARNMQQGRYRTKWVRTSCLLPGENKIDFFVPVGEPGKYEFVLQKIKVYGLTGLFATKISVKKASYLQVLPDAGSVAVRLSEAVRNFFGEADTYDEERSGPDPAELFGVREYVPGDRMQRVHWKLSAKADDLMVKENSLPKACPVILFMESDTSKKRRKKDAAESAFLQIAASLSFSLMDSGCPHYMVWTDAKTGDVARMRIDNEESYYLFLYSYLEQEEWNGKESAPLMELYRQKYRGEPYLIDLHLTGDLALYNGDQLLLEMSGQNVKEKLEEFELVL